MMCKVAVKYGPTNMNLCLPIVLYRRPIPCQPFGELISEILWCLEGIRRTCFWCRCCCGRHEVSGPLNQRRPIPPLTAAKPPAALRPPLASGRIGPPRLGALALLDALGWHVGVVGFG